MCCYPSCGQAAKSVARIPHGIPDTDKFSQRKNGNTRPGELPFLLTAYNNHWFLMTDGTLNNTCNNFAPKRLGIQFPFAGDDYVSPGNGCIKVHRIQNNLYSRFQCGIEPGYRPARDSSSGTSAWDLLQIDVLSFKDKMCNPPQSFVQFGNHLRCCSFLRAEDNGRSIRSIERIGNIREGNNRNVC